MLWESPIAHCFASTGITALTIIHDCFASTTAICYHIHHINSLLDLL
jgi:hypothetical protein